MAKIKLNQVMPGPVFEVVEKTPGDNYYRLVTMDQQSDDKIHWEFRPAKTVWARMNSEVPSEVEAGWRELAIAGLRECQEGRGAVVIQKILDGIAVEYRRFVGQPLPRGWAIQRV